MSKKQRQKPFSDEKRKAIIDFLWPHMDEGLRNASRKAIESSNTSDLFTQLLAASASALLKEQKPTQRDAVNLIATSQKCWRTVYIFMNGISGIKDHVQVGGHTWIGWHPKKPRNSIAWSENTMSTVSLWAKNGIIKNICTYVHSRGTHSLLPILADYQVQIDQAAEKLSDKERSYFEHDGLLAALRLCKK